MKKVLIANRGEIAARIAQACRTCGIRSVAVHTPAEAGALHVSLADEAVELDGPRGYRDADALLAAARGSGADAIHPGYGFLAESAQFAAAVAEAGLVWVGPGAEVISMMGDKIAARKVADRAEVPIVPGTDQSIGEASEVVAFGERFGWPVILKAAHGGGGRGLRVAHGAADVARHLEAAGREAAKAFGNDTVFVERFVTSARHVEVQVLADSHGNVRALGDRDCSVQRRHQKLVEEAPAPNLDPGVRAALAVSAKKLFTECGYVGAGTVEFLVDSDAHYFLEVNARLQVEHPITEVVTGVDIVVEQLRIASGHRLSVPDDPWPRGHALELRINAEDPGAGFAPHTGRLERLEVPHRVGVRFDSGYRSGDYVGTGFDSLLGKLIVWAADRPGAIRSALAVLDEIEIAGVPTTVPALRAVLSHDEFVAARISTDWFEGFIEPSLTDRGGSGPVLLPPGYVALGGRRLLVASPPEHRDLAVRRQPREAVLRPGDSEGAQQIGVVASSMTATVIELHVEVGAVVRTGDPVVTVEAMKMENTFLAPCDGVVVSVDVAGGAPVRARQQLAVIEPS